MPLTFILNLKKDTETHLFDNRAPGSYARLSVTNLGPDTAATVNIIEEATIGYHETVVIPSVRNPRAKASADCTITFSGEDAPPPG